MNEEEKKVVEDYKSKLDLYKYEKKIGLGRINIDEKIYEMEVIINVIERLQKENKKLKKSKITYERVRDIQEKNKNIVDKNYIPKKKIEAKIEELNEKVNQGGIIYSLKQYARCQKDVLEELLESEEK